MSCVMHVSSLHNSVSTIKNISDASAAGRRVKLMRANNCYCFQDKFRVSENHLRDSQITGKMREILIDWLVQVHLKFKLLHETLYLTVAIIDRFLQVGHTPQYGNVL